MTNEQKLVQGIRRGIVELSSLPGILDEGVGGEPTKKTVQLTEEQIEKQKSLDEERYRQAIRAGYKGSYESYTQIPER